MVNHIRNKRTPYSSNPTTPHVYAVDQRTIAKIDAIEELREKTII